MLGSNQFSFFRTSVEGFEGYIVHAVVWNYEAKKDRVVKFDRDTQRSVELSCVNADVVASLLRFEIQTADRFLLACPDLRKVLSFNATIANNAVHFNDISRVCPHESTDRRTKT